MSPRQDTGISWAAAGAATAIAIVLAAARVMVLSSPVMKSPLIRVLADHLPMTAKLRIECWSPAVTSRYFCYDSTATAPTPGIGRLPSRRSLPGLCPERPAHATFREEGGERR